MARTSAISIKTALNAAADLAEIYGIVIENVQKEALSVQLKSQNYSGNPAAGSVVFKRFTNSKSAPYGTARAAGHGDAVVGDEIVCNLNTHREIVEECAKFDIETYGVNSVLKRRALSHVKSMVRELDSAFFTAAGTAATATNTAETDALKRLEALIQDLETVQNDYVDGIPRDMIYVACTTSFFGLVRDGLDEKPNPNVDTAAEKFGMYHGVRVYESLYIPSGIDAIASIEDAMGQPSKADQYGEPTRIPQSNDYSVELFYHYGTKAVCSDLIFKLETIPSTLTELDVTSAAGAATNGSVITIDPAAAGTGNSFVYKLGTTYASFDYDDTLTTGWTALASGDDIACSTSTKITVAKIVTATGKARGRGIAVLVKKAAE